MGLSFLNPAFLWGMGIASIPVIIHLLYRRRFRRIRWAAMEFLRISEKKRSRRLRLEQLLLLLLRCLVMLFVALAICRPVVNTAGIPFLGARGPVHAILVVDNSFSMGFQPEGAGRGTLFDRASDRATDLLRRGLREGDAVSLVLGGDPPRVLIGRPTRDLTDATNALAIQARLGDGGTDFGKVAEICLRLFEDSTFVNREVYLLTDNQHSGWQAPGREPQLEAWRALADRARINVLDAAALQAPNQAVTDVRLAGGLVTTQTTGRVEATLANHSPAPLSQALVSLDVDGATAESQRVNLPAGDTATVSFRHLFDRPGLHTVSVRLPGDRLPADDVRHLVARARESVRILVLNGKPDSLPQRDGAFFLRYALAPPPLRPGEPPPALDVTVRTGMTFGEQGLRDQDVVILSDVAALADGDRSMLAQFVQDGGGALLFLGGRVNAALYNRDLYEGTPSLLPARLTGTRDAPPEKLFLDPNRLAHPALARFMGAEDVDLNTAQIHRFVDMEEPEENTSAAVMARFTNGSPALLERRFGAGSVVVFASTANTEWNELPFKPVFLPLLQELVAYLAGGADRNQRFQVGQPLSRPVPLAKATQIVTVLDPDGETHEAAPFVGARGAAVTYDGAEVSGFYRFAIPGEAEQQVAVNLDPRESDLTRLTSRQLAGLLPRIAFTWIEPQEELLAAITRARMGVELWRHLLLAALALMLIETALAQKFGRR